MAESKIFIANLSSRVTYFILDNRGRLKRTLREIRKNP